ncbi:MAG: hypothetical protein DME19_19380 [Verrucomicrobia bacterium]|nr:MAG: hypothetical protein DME19_19380 [Verrucomicrobiota bacterium]
MNFPLTRPSAFAKATADESGTLSPSQGERDGVRGFTGREHAKKSDASWGRERWGEIPSSPDLPWTVIRARGDARPTRFIEREKLARRSPSGFFMMPEFS